MHARSSTRGSIREKTSSEDDFLSVVSPPSSIARTSKQWQHHSRSMPFHISFPIASRNRFARPSFAHSFIRPLILYWEFIITNNLRQWTRLLFHKVVTWRTKNLWLSKSWRCYRGVASFHGNVTLAVGSLCSRFEVDRWESILSHRRGHCLGLITIKLLGMWIVAWGETPNFWRSTLYAV